MMATKLPLNIQKGGRWTRAQIMEVSSNGRNVTMRELGCESFQMNTAGQDTTSGLPTLREAIHRIFPTLVRLSQITEDPDFKNNAEREERTENRKQIRWAQALHSLRAQPKELEEANPTSRGDSNISDPELTDLKNGEHAFLATRPKLIQLDVEN